MSLVLVALMDAIRKRIAANADQQSQYNLRILVTPFLGETGFAKLVLIVRFKIECSDIIKQYIDMAA